MRELSVVDCGVVSFGVALQWQAELQSRRVAGAISDVLLLLEHPHVYSLGRTFKREHLIFDETELQAASIEIAEADRGGSITYHGPGQMIGYPIIDLRRPGHEVPDALKYLRTLEETVIRTARSLGVIAGRRQDMTGVWVGDKKLSSIGVNVSRGVSKHGVGLNVSTDLAYFDGMLPCGMQAEMTSLDELTGVNQDMDDVKQRYARHVAEIMHYVLIWRDRASLGLRFPKEDDAVIVDLDARRQSADVRQLKGSRLG